jgi:hypothetical protein
MVEQAEDQMKMARRVVSERLQVFFFGAARGA